jgi:hypothetical protein
MPRAFSVIAVSFAIVAGAATVRAQSAPAVAGKWAIEFERGRRMENGEATAIMGTGTLTITSQADSLIATLESPPRPDGTPAPPATMFGRLGAEGAVFKQTQKVTLSMNGEMTTHDMLVTWVLKANGDVLTGTMARELPMAPEQPAPAPVKGTRIKS